MRTLTSPKKPRFYEKYPYISFGTVLVFLFQGLLWLASRYLPQFKSYETICLGLFAGFFVCAALYYATEGEEVCFPIASVGLLALLNAQCSYFGYFPSSFWGWAGILFEFMTFGIFCLYLSGLIRHDRTLSELGNLRNENPRYGRW